MRSTLLPALLLGLVGCRTTGASVDGTAVWDRDHRQPPPRLAVDVTDSNHVFVDGEIAGQVMPMLVDSGAGRFVLDRSFARSLGLAKHGRIQVAGAGGGQVAHLVHVPELRVGDLRIRNAIALSLDLEPVSVGFDRPIRVVLGRGLFHNAVVEIDYPNEQLVLHRPRGFRAPGASEVLPLRDNALGLKDVPCQIEDLPPAWVQIDTGSGLTLGVFRDFADRHSLLQSRPARSVQRAGGVGGFLFEPLATVSQIALGRFVIHDVPVGFPVPVSGSLAAQPLDGNLGGSILRRFRLWIDFGRDELHLEPGAQLNRPFYREHMGLYTEVRDDSLTVLLAAPGSPAAEAGIRDGMVIERVNGHSQKSPQRLRRRLRRAGRQPLGSKVQIRANGQDFEVTLRRYY